MRMEVESISPAEPLVRTWVLHSTGTGANRQLVSLARALGGEYVVKDVLDPSFTAVIDRLTPWAAAHIPARKRKVLRPPWPDVVLFGGGRSVTDALRIRTASSGRSRLVCIGRPAAPLNWFDLIITTPQYGLPQHESVLHMTLPLNARSPEENGEAVALSPEAFLGLSRPWYGVLLGGDSTTHRFTTAAARDLAHRLTHMQRIRGGSFLITTSPRTPDAVTRILANELTVPGFFYQWQRDDPNNPLPAILAHADAFVVTDDSASMLAEACASGRPVASFPLPHRPLTRLLTLGHQAMPALGPLGSRLAALRCHLVAAGLWVPARNMMRIHEALRAEGRVRDIESLADGLADESVATRPTAAGRTDDLRRAVVAVHAMVRSARDSVGIQPPRR